MFGRKRRKNLMYDEVRDYEIFVFGDSPVQYRPLRKGENNYMFVERNPHTGEAMYDYSAKYVVYQHNEHGDEITIFLHWDLTYIKQKVTEINQKIKEAKGDISRILSIEEDNYTVKISWDTKVYYRVLRKGENNQMPVGRNLHTKAIDYEPVAKYGVYQKDEYGDETKIFLHHDLEYIKQKVAEINQRIKEEKNKTSKS